MDYVMNPQMKTVRDELLELVVELINSGTEEDNGRKLHVAAILGTVAAAIQEGVELEIANAARTWGERHLVSWT